MLKASNTSQSRLPITVMGYVIEKLFRLLRHLLSRDIYFLYSKFASLGVYLAQIKSWLIITLCRNYSIKGAHPSQERELLELQTREEESNEGHLLTILLRTIPKKTKDSP